jgi:hypothetical protein
VVDGVVAHLALDSSGASEVRKLGQQGIDRSTATDDFHAQDQRTGGLGRGRQRRDSIQQAVLAVIAALEVEVEVEVEVTLRPTVNQSVCLGIEHLCGTCDQILLPVGIFLSEICGLVSLGRPF